jgi:transposase
MEIPIAIRKLVVQLREDGNSFRNIAQIIKKSHSTVQYIINRYNETGSFEDRKRTGRPQKLKPNQKRAILRTVVMEPKTSAPKLAGMIDTEYNVKVVPQTIRNVIRNAGYKGCVARKKPFISQINKKKRLDFAKAHINKGNDFWKSVLFSDESKFNIFGSDGRVMVWRKPNMQMDCRNLCPTVKHGGGNVLVWGCMSATGVGNLVFIDGIMDQHMYLNILRNNLHESAEKLNIGNSFIFQQDNDPKHTAKKVKEWLLYRVPKQLNTPPQSPDMNPIEHLWDEIGRRLKKYQTRNKDQLKNAITEVWNSIDSAVTIRLVESMDKRMHEVIRAKGGPTDH